jgi:two-component system sensor histidine kinase DesK
LALSVREALTNVVRHSCASEVDVTLDIIGSNLVVEISDNGRGFRLGTTVGQGLLNMKGRMDQVGGIFECESAPGKGTKARFRVPLIRGRAPEKK